MPELYSLDAKELQRFLERRRASLSFPLEMSLADNLAEILRKADEFVPSKAGSILLDNPNEKKKRRNENTLTFIAAFGPKSQQLVGRRIPADKGIAGYVYIQGKSYCTPDVQRDPLFYAEFDKENDYYTHSLVAIPIRIEQEVCGVLELVNRREAKTYSQQDLNLLEIFAGYMSVSIQNVLDGRLAQEIAKRDNLTGLYNDRYLHIALSQRISDCWEDGRDLSLLFLDLDFFKRVNDSHGHLAGSQVLREVGQLLDVASRPAAAVAARYGGDEFVLALPGLDIDAAIDLAERVREEIVTTTYCATEGEIQPDPLHLKGITCSVGIASLRRHVGDTDNVESCKSTLLRLADAAMYVAKETGRNRTAVAGELVRRRDV
jgi:diguanylate cyclase (GGDEF)-like protein